MGGSLSVHVMHSQNLGGYGDPMGIMWLTVGGLQISHERRNENHLFGSLVWLINSRVHPSRCGTYISWNITQ